MDRKAVVVRRPRSPVAHMPVPASLLMGIPVPSLQPELSPCQLAIEAIGPRPVKPKQLSGAPGVAAAEPT